MATMHMAFHNDGMRVSCGVKRGPNVQTRENNECDAQREAGDFWPAWEALKATVTCKRCRRSWSWDRPHHR